ncbi:MAG TPA: DUF5063 domain-containing protein [Rhizomicrobium sp.]
MSRPSSQDIEVAIEQLLLLIETRQPDDDFGGIAVALTRLISLAVELRGVGFVAFPTPPPNASFKARYKEMGSKFPQLGLYASGDFSTENIGQPSTAGDGIDDLVDICGDLNGFLWLAKNGHREGAIWHFRNLFEIHWGRHASELLLYLIASGLA